MRILYDSKNSKFKTPFGCVKEKETVNISIHIPKPVKTSSVSVCLTDDNGVYGIFPLKLSGEYDMYEIYSGTFSIEKAGLYFYCFKITGEQSSFSLYKQGSSDTNMEAGDMWQLTCVKNDYKTPDRFKGAVMYQIFPDRFNSEGQCDLTEKLTPFTVHADKNEVPVYWANDRGEVLNNDFYGGNLNGITQKLGYIASLGVKIIYLNPIFKAFSNHRYDTADYKTIDPMLGTYEDFAGLCAEAKKLGISVILDGVFSHTGSNSIYFKSAVSDENSPYRSWYNFENYPDSYDCWWGIKTLPNVNEISRSYMDYIINDADSVIAHWLNAGADGFRLDVADELPDEFIYALRKRVKELKPDAIVIGEVWEDASNKSSYGKRRRYFANSELDSVMNYPFSNAILGFAGENTDGFSFADSVMTIAENYPKEALLCLMNSISTHDTVRALTVLGGQPLQGEKKDKENLFLTGQQYENAVQKLKTAAFLQYMLPGNPCIYYGDEIGMQGFEDPLNRRYFTWDNIDNDVLLYFKRLGELKNAYDDLKTGGCNVYAEDKDTVIIDRGAMRAAVCRNGAYNGKFKSGYDVVFEHGGCCLLKKHEFEKLSEILDREILLYAVLSNKRNASAEYKKITLTPFEADGEVMYQFECFTEKQAVHKNINDFRETLFELMHKYKNLSLFTENADFQILIGKKGNLNIKKSAPTRKPEVRRHNKERNYYFKEGTVYPFLTELGITNADGSVKPTRYNKFVQINRYTEIVGASLGCLSGKKKIRIADFGCGKAYLTFALYYYLTHKLGAEVEIFGIDLKTDVIEYCDGLAKKLGYSGLKFINDDINNFDGSDIDIAVSLHACDIATDIALIKAAQWGSKLIIAVPCCHHELFNAIKNDTLNPILKYGILKDKFASIVTDAMRGLALQTAGYDVNIMEFTPAENTPKNVLIKAVRTGKGNESAKLQYDNMKKMLNITPYIDRLVKDV